MGNRSSVPLRAGGPRVIAVMGYATASCSIFVESYSGGCVCTSHAFDGERSSEKIMNELNKSPKNWLLHQSASKLNSGLASIDRKPHRSSLL